MTALPLPYIDVEGRAAGENNDIRTTVQIHIDGSAEGNGVVDTDLAEAVLDYLEGVTGALYPMVTFITTKHVQTDTVL